MPLRDYEKHKAYMRERQRQVREAEREERALEHERLGWTVERKALAVAARRLTGNATKAWSLIEPMWPKHVDQPPPEIIGKWAEHDEGDEHYEEALRSLTTLYRNSVIYQTGELYELALEKFRETLNNFDTSKASAHDLGRLAVVAGVLADKWRLLHGTTGGKETMELGSVKLILDEPPKKLAEGAIEGEVREV